MTSSPEVKKTTHVSGSTAFISTQKDLAYMRERVPHPSGRASLDQISMVVVPTDVHLHAGAEKVVDLFDCVLADRLGSPVHRRKMSDWSSRDHVTLPNSRWR